MTEPNFTEVERLSLQEDFLSCITDEDLPSILNGLEYLKTTSLIEKLNIISNETIIIHGDHDTIIPSEHSKIINEKLKNSTLRIIPEADHLSLFYKHLFYKAGV